MASGEEVKVFVNKLGKEKKVELNAPKKGSLIKNLDLMDDYKFF